MRRVLRVYLLFCCLAAPGVFASAAQAAAPQASGYVNTADNVEPLEGVVVYADIDDDGTKDSGEPEALTDADGFYSLADMPLGRYRIRLEDRSDFYCQSLIEICRTAKKTWTDDQSDEESFSVFRVSVDLSGQLYDDLDGDGSKDPGEPGRAGVMVYQDLLSADGNNLRLPFAITDENGNWSFQGAPGDSSSIRIAGAQSSLDRYGWQVPGSADALQVDLFPERGGCMLLDDGSVKCWGENWFGRMGKGIWGGNSMSPAAVQGLSGATQISLGYAHACALTDSGVVKCWGENTGGELGNGNNTRTNSASTQVAGIGDAQEVAAGAGGACARLSGGSVKCWGAGWGNTPVIIDGVSGATAIAAAQAGGQYCAIANGGEVWCWHGGGTPAGVTGIEDVTQIGLGTDHGCALRSDGTVWCWGSNGGKLGNGQSVDSSTPVQVSGLTGIDRIQADGYFSCAWKEGQAWCWGYGVGVDAAYASSGGVKLVPWQSERMSGKTSTAWVRLKASCWKESEGLRCAGPEYSDRYGSGSLDSLLYPTVSFESGDTVDLGAVGVGGALAAASFLSKPSVLSNQTSGLIQTDISGDRVQPSCFDDYNGSMAGAGECQDKLFGSMTEGEHFFAVSWKDRWGAWSLPASYDWTVDLTAPDAPTLSGVPNNPTSSKSASIDFTGETGAQFSYSTDGGDTWSAYSSASNYSASGLGDGQHTLMVRQKDQAGNVSESSEKAQWTIDTQGPTASWQEPTSPSNNSSLSYSLTFSEAPIGFTSADLQQVGTATGCSLDLGAPSGLVYQVTVSGCGDGSVVLRLAKDSVQDALGNNGPAAHIDSSVVVLDRTAPGAPVISSTPLASTYSRIAQFAFAGDPGNILRCQVDSGSWDICASPLMLQGLAYGQHVFRVKQTDAAGNASPAVEWTWQVLPPRLGVESFYAGASKPSDSSSLLGGTGPVYTNKTKLVLKLKFNIPVQGLEATDFALSGRSQGWAVSSITGSAAGPYYVTIQADNPRDGSLAIRLLRDQLLGPQSQTGPSIDVQVEEDIIIDRTAPRMPGVSGVPKSSTPKNRLYARLSGETGAKFQYSLDGKKWKSCSSRPVFHRLSQGYHTIRFRQIDRAGNIGKAWQKRWRIRSASFTG